MADQYQDWTNQLVGEEGANSGNIFQNAARLGNANASQSSVAGNVAQANENIDQVKQSNAAAAQSAATDPSKAQMQLLPNNQGYAFYDGAGNRISINQYSLLVGKTPAQLLQDSSDPADQQFVQDYNTLQKFTNAWANGDTKTLAQMKATDPDTFNNLISTYKSPAALISAFTQHYSNYYGTNISNNQNPQSSNFISDKLAPNNLVSLSSTTGQKLATSTLPQILNTSTEAAPSVGPNNIASKLPWTNSHKTVQSYEQYLKGDPWAQYQIGANSPYYSFAQSLFKG